MSFLTLLLYVNLMIVIDEKLIDTYLLLKVGFILVFITRLFL